MFSRIVLISAVLLLTSSWSPSLPAGTSANAQAIVERADDIRFPRKSFQISITVTSSVKAGTSSVHEYQLLQKGHENSVVRTLSPATEKGQVMLLKGSELWLFLPSVSQPVRLPLAQRLTGQVANGDLARANFAGDYNASLLKEEEIKGRRYYVLELLAARKGVTYHRVMYWVDSANYRPYRAEFYTLSNRLMKVGIYDSYREMAGAIRPARLTLKDALRIGEESVIEYNAMKLRDIPDKFFTKDFLRKLGN